MASLQPLKYCKLWLQQTVAASSCKWPLCNLSNILNIGFNKLWRLPAANGLYVTSQNVVVFMLNKLLFFLNELWWHPATKSLSVIPKILWSLAILWPHCCVHCQKINKMLEVKHRLYAAWYCYSSLHQKNQAVSGHEWSLCDFSQWTMRASSNE